MPSKLPTAYPVMFPMAVDPLEPVVLEEPETWVPELPGPTDDPFEEVPPEEFFADELVVGLATLSLEQPSNIVAIAKDAMIFIFINQSPICLT
jgi:hypothetical protein